jgi:hypothetical protein
MPNMTASDLQLSRCLKTSTSVTSVELDGERVLLHIETGEYYGLNPLGAHIFELAEEEEEEEMTLADIVGAVQEAHADVDPDRVEADVLAFVEEMQSYDLLHLGEHPRAV